MQYQRKLLKTKEAAEFLTVSVSYLEKDRNSKNPTVPFKRIGKSVVYDIDELNEFLSGLSGNGKKPERITPKIKIPKKK